MIRFPHLSLTLLPILFGVASCATTEEITYHDTPVEEQYMYYEIDDNVGEDEAISAFIRPYAKSLSRTMDQVLTVSDGLFKTNQPEGALGNLAADIVRYRATAEMRERVHVSVLHNQNLCIPLAEGKITVRQLYELLPMDNEIVVLGFTGEQLLQITDELAAVNGEPVSGIRFRIINNKAQDVLVNTQNVDPDSYYLVATGSWMADGGGPSPTLWEPVERYNLGVLIREAVIDYLSVEETITPYRDQRVRN